MYQFTGKNQYAAEKPVIGGSMGKERRPDGNCSCEMMANF